ncbi:MAG: GtrA family protein [Treponema sp.]|jgi:putative flippase GtrA|nr:GtrA family protein [Treponema sp.]
MPTIDRALIIRYIKQFLRFGIVGFFNTVLSLAIYYFFIWINPDLYLLGSISAFIITAAIAYILSRKFVFPDGRETAGRSLVKALIAYSFSFIFANGLLVLQVEVIHVSKVLAPILNLFVTVPLNFTINKFWTYKAH